MQRLFLVTANCDNAIDVDILNGLGSAAWPEDFQFDRRRVCSQSEMQFEIVLISLARPCFDVPCQCPVRKQNLNDRAYR